MSERERPTNPMSCISSHQMCSSRDEIILEGNPLLVDQYKPYLLPADAVDLTEITSARRTCIHVHVCTEGKIV